MGMENKFALVTGSNRGLGHAIARGLLRAGFSVLCTTRSGKESDDWFAQLQKSGKALFHHLDISDQSSIDTCFAFAKAHTETLDVLVNNAGINYDTWQNIENADVDQMLETLNVNALGALRVTQTFLPLLDASVESRVINVSSTGGTWAAQTGSTPAYSVSKLALNGLTLQLAHLLNSRPISVYAVCPGWVQTDMGGAGASKTPDQGADTIIWLSTGTTKPDGKLYRDRAVIDW